MKYKINLLPPKKQSFVDRIIYFSFNYLRYILVITQLVVIAVFFYRFKIDQEIVDLKEGLKQKEEIVTVSNALLKEMKTLSIKTDNINSILTSQTSTNDMLQYLLNRFPEDLYITKFTLTPTGITFEGYTQNINAVRLFYNRLSQEGYYKQISLDNLRKEEINYVFSFKLATEKDSI